MSAESSEASGHLSGPLLVVDPNVLISAAITGRGPTLQLIQAAATGSMTLAVSLLLLGPDAPANGPTATLTAQQHRTSAPCR